MPHPKINSTSYQLVKGKMLHKQFSSPCFAPTENHPSLNENGSCVQQFGFAYQRYTLVSDDIHAKQNAETPY